MQLPLPQLTLILSLLALLIGLYCLWQNRSLNTLRKIFFAGQKALDLESVILSLKQQQKDNRQQQVVLEQALDGLKNNISFAVQKVGLVRFNPFGDSGGNFSFCLALLDGHNNGVIITSMYGREQNRIYSKKIENGKSDIQLTEEEQRSVLVAKSPAELVTIDESPTSDNAALPSRTTTKSKKIPKEKS